MLRPGGTLGLIWNTRDTNLDWVARLGRIMDGGHAPAGYSGEPTIGSPFETAAYREERWSYRIDISALLDLTASRSAFLTMTESRRADVLAEVRALFEEVARPSLDEEARSEIAIPYLTRCFRTRRAWAVGP